MAKDKNKVVESEVAEEVTEKAPATKKDTIEVSAGLLQELIDSNKELQKKVDLLDSNAVATNPNGIQVRKKTREFDYFLRKWEGKIVVGFENVGTEKRPLYVYNIYDKDTRKDVQYVNLVLKDTDEVVKEVNYVDFLRYADKIKTRKISQVEREIVTEHGMIPKKEMAENGYGMFETTVMVPVEVTEKLYTMTLQLPEDEGGDQVVIDSRWVNI